MIFRNTKIFNELFLSKLMADRKKWVRIPKFVFTVIICQPDDQNPYSSEYPTF